MNWVCIDGNLVPANEAKISVWDHGLLYGDGLFETMRSYNGKVFALSEHLQRLRQGADLLELDIEYSDTELKDLLNTTLEANHLANAYIRLTYTRGSGPIGIDPALCSRGCLIIMVKEPNVSESLYRNGSTLGISPVVRNHSSALPPSVKSLNFLNNILAKLWAKQQGFAEALMLNQQGFITETTVSNIFFVIGQKIFTPSLEAGILPGITRNMVIRAANGIGLHIGQGLFTPGELVVADEVFLTNSGSEIIPIVQVDRKIIGSGKPGQVTRQIHEAFKKLVEET